MVEVSVEKKRGWQVKYFHKFNFLILIHVVLGLRTLRVTSQSLNSTNYAMVYEFTIMTM